MPPYPKHPSVRARRNKPSSSKEIVVAAPVVKPALPPRYKKIEGKRTSVEYHPNAVAVWDAIWESEMVDELLQVDAINLIRLAEMESQFWEKSEEGRSIVTLNAEIMHTIKEYGLTVMRRRALGWVIAQTEESQVRAGVMRSSPRSIAAVQGPVIQLPPSSIIEDDPDMLFD